jgi:phosphoadenosine phosphosulfate reductase
MTDLMHLNLVNLAAKMPVAEQESRFGILNQTAPDRCCAIRKVEPLFRGLADYGVWFTALRREQSPTRANLQPVDHFKLPTGHQLLKVSPLADWTNSDVWAYLKRRGIPVLPLYHQGYTSIGCAPCTELPFDPENARSGRWHGKKLECGIHIQAE